ncbi:hypothetical protein CP8484711_1657, partial [Chlamydia psittaci 84-8471/1]|jgi:hypothetical protein
LY